ncbi:MAG: efflux RND transporter periplasmic adaptor subunit [Cytophagales bacterium]|nr:efflux RND transporter periplasmic adaptor subunit [Cytophagales bacterium]
MKKIIGILFLLASWSCSPNEQADASGPEASTPAFANTVELSKEQYDASGIQLGTVEDRPLSGSIQVTGMLDVPPQNLVNITAPLGGFLRSTDLLQGMRVSKGQVIAVIENPEYIQLQQDFLDTRSQVDFLEMEFQRQSHLAEENVNAQKTLQKAQADLISMKARNSGLRAKLKMLHIDADKLQPEKISSTIELRSPIRGYVTQVYSSIGAFASPTDILFKIVDTEHLHAELTCFERDVPKIKIGQKIRFVLSYETAERLATVFLIGKEIGPDRTVRIHGHLDKEDIHLMPGMYLKAVIETGSESVPSLPEEAVLNFEDKEIIFISTSSQAYKLLEIQTGVREDGWVAVTLPAGVPATVSVVVKNAHKLLSKLKNSDLEE